MLYDYKNCMDGTSVYDVDRKEKLAKVVSVDCNLGEVVACEQPYRIVNDDVASYTLRFRSIYPIAGGAPWPCLFHCYGRLQ